MCQNEGFLCKPKLSPFFCMIYSMVFSLTSHVSSFLCLVQCRELTLCDSSAVLEFLLVCSVALGQLKKISRFRLSKTAAKPKWLTSSEVFQCLLSLLRLCMLQNYSLVFLSSWRIISFLWRSSLRIQRMRSNVFTCLGCLNAQELSPMALYLQNEVVHNYVWSLVILWISPQHLKLSILKKMLSKAIWVVCCAMWLSDVLCLSQNYSALILLFRSLSQVLGFGLFTIPLDLILSPILCINAMSGFAWTILFSHPSATTHPCRRCLLPMSFPALGVNRGLQCRGDRTLSSATGSQSGRADRLDVGTSSMPWGATWSKSFFNNWCRAESNFSPSNG